MAVIYQQNFEGLTIGDDMTLNGYTYVPFPANVAAFNVIAGQYGEIKVTAGTWGGGHHLTAGSAWTDYKVTSKTISWGSGRYLEAVRCNTVMNKCYWIQCQPGNPAAELIIFKGDLDYPTNALSVAAVVPPATSGELRIECVANNIKVYIDGVLFIDYTDLGIINGPAILSGSIGFGAFTSGWVVNDIVVDDFTIPPVPPVAPTFDILDDLLEHYTNLLIIQYNQLPKAKATIELIVNELVASELYFEVRDGFNIDTAVGAQLDILDKYIGVGRDNKGELITDDDFRFLMKFKIIQNSSDHTTTSINESLDAFFGTNVRMESIGGMSLTYYANDSVIDQAVLALEKKVLPKPMGVNIILIKVQDEPFAFLEYVAVGSETPKGFDNLAAPGNGGIFSNIL